MSNHGPNVTKLILQFVSREAVPPGGGIWNAVEFITNEEKRKEILIRAERSALVSIEAIKYAPDNPYGTDDETIAKILLEKIAERKENKK